MTVNDWGHPGFLFVNVVEAFPNIDPTGAADSGPGLIAARNALIENSAGQIPFIPAGTYKLTTAVPFALGGDEAAGESDA